MTQLRHWLLLTLLAGFGFAACLPVPAPPEGSSDDPDPIDNKDDDADDDDDGADPNPRPDGGTRPPPDGGTGQTAVELTHSTTNNIAASHSILCADGNDHHLATSFYRVFDLAALQPGKGIAVEKVDFGIELANDAKGAGQPIFVRMHTIAATPGTTFSVASLTAKANAAHILTDTTRSVVSVPITADIAAGEKLVVEIFMPDGHDNSQAGHSAIVGSNSGGQSGPTYIKDECEANQPTNVANVGGGQFSDVHLVLSVHGKTL